MIKDFQLIFLMWFCQYGYSLNRTPDHIHYQNDKSSKDELLNRR